MNCSLHRRLHFCLALLFLVVFSVKAADPIPAVELTVAFPNLKFNRPLWMEEAPDGSKRLIVIEQGGKVFIFPNEANARNAKVFLDISDRKPWVQNEEGLLAFAFHPQFKTNGCFYIYYSQQGPKRIVLSEIKVSSSDPDKADLATERILMEIDQPYWNHNGGAVLFGPDGFLYLTPGDGG